LARKEHQHEAESRSVAGFRSLLKAYPEERDWHKVIGAGGSQASNDYHPKEVCDYLRGLGLALFAERPPFDFPIHDHSSLDALIAHA
jgi:hypothetical protein